LAGWLAAMFLALRDFRATFRRGVRAHEGDGVMVDEQPGADPTSSTDARLDRLDERVAEAQRREEARAGKGPPADTNEQTGQRVLSYLLGGLLGGALLGWLFDGWFGTGHKLLVAGVVLGTIGGFWSIIRLSLRK
jgi:ATP synthase protein I